MSDFIPKPGTVKVGGLGPKAAKLQALREKMAAKAQGGDKQAFSSAAGTSKMKGANAPTKKVAFQRKAT